MVALNFNPMSVAPNVGFEPVPSGIYPVMITKSEEKPTKNGRGSYIQLTMTIQGGEFNGRVIIDRLNTRNENEQTMEIAYRTLSSICRVCGHYAHLADTQQIHGRPFQVVVSKIPRDDRPDLMSNEVRGYKDINGNDPGDGQAANGGQAWANGGGNQQTTAAQQTTTAQTQQADPNANTQQGGQAAATEKPPWIK